MHERSLTALRQHILAHAETYYSDLQDQPARVHLTNITTHTASVIYHFIIKSRTTQHALLVKTPPERNLRNRLTEQTDPETKFHSEFAALTHIYDYFNRLHDSRFAAIRPLDFVSEFLGIVMEEVMKPSLRSLLSRTSRLQPWSKPARLYESFRNAGSWLRAFHALAPPDQAVRRDSFKSDYVSDLEKYSAFLADATGDATFFRDLASRAIAEASEVLPETLPLGLTHGDYALRNLLVDSGGRVLALDTQAKWLMPIYEDPAYFLIGLMTTWPQVMSQGLVFDPARLKKLEQEFLQGYFENEPVPCEAIRLFKIKIMLIRWSAKAFRFTRSHLEDRSRFYALKRTRQRLLHRYFRNATQALVQASRNGRQSTVVVPAAVAECATAIEPIRTDENLRLSRRLDWRFLLPQPDLLRVAYFGPAEVSLATALKKFSESFTPMTGSQTARDLNESGGFDIAVLRSPSLKDLERASILLKPGGGIYVEIESLWAATVRYQRNPLAERFQSLKHYLTVLEQHGFVDIEAYWHRPSFERCVEIIPLHDRTTKEFVFSRSSSGLLSQIKFAAGRYTLKSNYLMRLLQSVSVVARMT